MSAVHRSRTAGTVAALGYLGLTSTDTDAWADMARTIGMAVAPSASGIVCAVDDRSWRFAVQRGEADDLAFVGWELHSVGDLDALRTRIASLGHAIVDIPSIRDVVQGFATTDPDGNALELFVGAPVRDGGGAAPTAAFTTGELGLGHVVLFCHDFEAMLDFYVGALGFVVSDTYGSSGADVAFLHCNQRHHSLALARGRTDHVMQHFMVEVADIDAVGRCFDACASQGLAQSTLGRHTNDRMFSFYVLAPGGYTIEYGADGRLIQGPELQPHFLRTSDWGHHDLVPSR